MDYDSVPPVPARYNQEAEKSVLGAILLDGDLYGQVSEILGANDFYFIAHIWLFKAFGKLVEDGKSTELILTSLDADEKLSDFGGKKYFAALMESTPSTASVRDYARLIRSHSVARQVAAFGTELNLSASNHSTDVSALLEAARERVKNLAETAKGSATPWWNPEDASVERWIDTKPPPRQMIVPDFLPMGIVAILAAEGGTGKSYASIQAGIAIALGLPLFNLYPCSEPSGVLLVFAEESQDEIWRRTYYLFRFMVGEHPDFDRMRELLIQNLHIKSMLGEDCLLTDMDGTVCKKTDLPAKLVAVTKAYNNVKLIIMDPIANMHGGEENSNQHATIFVNVLAWVGLQLGGISIMAVHHTNKASVAEQELTQGAIRGAGAFVNSARMAILMRRVGKKEERNLGIPPGTHKDFALWKVVKGNYTPSQDMQLLRQTSSGAFIHVEQKSMPTPSEPSNMEVVSKVMMMIRTQLASGMQYTKTGFAQQFCSVIGVGENRLAAILDESIESGVLGLADPVARVGRNVKKVLVVIDKGY
ncbi:MAG: AAA family ATPase [Magnetococcales bacterium]|nr:AAA family ATPase [Magnetococcales bacterium]